MDEPKGTEETFGFATAGWNAAPVAGTVIERIAPFLGIPAAIEPGETEEEPSIVWESIEGGRHASL